MSKILLSAAKAHLRVDGSSEDSLIEDYLAAAYFAAEGKIFRKIYDHRDDIPVPDVTGIEADPAINAAVFLILGHLYANREAVSQGPVGVEVPLGAEWLLAPYINFDGGA